MVIINLSQSLKNKRDAEFRRNQSRSDKRLIIDSEGNVDVGDSKDYLTQAVTRLNDLQGDISLAEGDNIRLEVVGNDIVISSSGGGLEELPQATDTDLGGIRASERTANEVSEVKIDLETGKLYAPAPDPAVNGVPAGGKEGQILAKIDDVDYSTEWVDIALEGQPFGEGRVDFHDGKYAQSNGTFYNVFQYIIIKEGFWLDKLEYTVTTDSSMRLIVRGWSGDALARTEEKLVVAGEVARFNLKNPIFLHQDDYIVIEVITATRSNLRREGGFLYDGQLFKVVQLQVNDFIEGPTHSETLALKLIEYQD